MDGTSTPTWQLQRPVSSGLLVRLQVATAVIRTPQAERRETTRVEMETERAVPVRTEERRLRVAVLRPAAGEVNGLGCPRRDDLLATCCPARQLR